jgi:ATP dependent DNA ligase domain|nr:MAG TPA: ATP-dependent DNA ligase [Caudoviricetes sp.]
MDCTKQIRWCVFSFKFKNGVVYSRTQRPLFIPKESVLSQNISELKSVYNNSESDFILFELCLPETSLEKLSGLVSPNRKESWNEEEVNFQFSIGIHDSILLDDNGEDREPYATRYRRASSGLYLPFVSSVYYRTSPNNNCHDFIDKVFESIVRSGGESIVLKDPNGIYRMGKRVNTQVKRVREYLEDVRIEQVKYGAGKRNGQIGSMYCCSVDNPEIAFWADFGLNWDDEKRVTLTKDYEFGRQPLIGSIWTVKGLQPSSTGKSIRLPKLMHMRFDKE